MPYKALNMNSNQSGKRTQQRDSGTIWIDPRPVQADPRATPISHSARPFLDHLRWYFRDRVLIDDNNKYYVIKDISLKQEPTTSYYWNDTYRILFYVGGDRHVYVNINLNNKQKLEDVYGDVIKHIHSNIRVKSMADVTEAEKVLFMDVV
jgi:hypothetical protein